MNFSIKKSIFLVLLSMMSLAAMAQVEVKINPIGALFNSPDLSIEYIAMDNFGVEGRVGYSWSNLGSSDDLEYKGRGLVFIGAGKYYFNPNAGGDKFYFGAYTKFRNSTYTSSIGDDSVEITRQRLAVGPMLGYKILAKNKRVVFDFNFGAGRALMNKYSENATDDFRGLAITKLDLISSLAIGYRF